MRLSATWRGLTVTANYTKGTTADAGPDPSELEDLELAMQVADIDFEAQNELGLTHGTVDVDLPPELSELLLENDKYRREMIENLMEEV